MVTHKMTPLLVGLVSALLVLGACSDEENGLPGGNHSQEDPDTGLDVDDIDDADTSGEPDVDEVDDVGADTDVSEDPDTDFDADTGNGEEEYPQLISGPCGPMMALGVLEWGEDTTLDIDMDDFDNNLHTHCDEALGDGDVALFRFQTPPLETGELVVTADGMAGELRIGSCHDDALNFGCSVETVHAPLQPGTTYFLLLEPLEDNSQESFELHLEFEELPTCPAEDFETGSCIDESTIEVCNVTQYSPDAVRVYSAECPSGQCVNDRCVGDSCDDPIFVTTNFHWEGRNLGHFANHNSLDEVEQEQENATCLIDDDPNFPAESWGRELVFEVDDLSPGDEIVVTVDAEHPDQLRVIFKEDCSSTASCLAVSAGEQTSSYQVDDEDRIFVFVDTFFDFDQYFDLSIEVQ